MYKRQGFNKIHDCPLVPQEQQSADHFSKRDDHSFIVEIVCLLYTSDAADERSSVDLGGRRIIKKKKQAE